jgi:hypothetical protein
MYYGGDFLPHVIDKLSFDVQNGRSINVFHSGSQTKKERNNKEKILNPLFLLDLDACGIESDKCKKNEIASGHQFQINNFYHKLL